jgi:hypothetical protein
MFIGDTKIARILHQEGAREALVNIEEMVDLKKYPKMH